MRASSGTWDEAHCTLLRIFIRTSRLDDSLLRVATCKTVISLLSGGRRRLTGDTSSLALQRPARPPRYVSDAPESVSGAQ